MAELNGIVRGKASNIASQTIDKDKIYNITDIEGISLTNAQMASAITSAQEGIIRPNAVYMCSDSGTYTKDKFYRFTPNYATGTASWVEASVGMTVLTGTTDPTTATVGQVGQFYLNTTTPKLFQCTVADTTTPSYTWSPIGGSSTLNGLSDVDAGSSVNGDILRWDSAQSKWKGTSLPENLLISVTYTTETNLELDYANYTKITAQSGALAITLKSAGGYVPEYRAKITTANSSAVTFPSGTAIYTNDSTNCVIASNVATLATTKTYEINVQDGVCYIFVE